MTSQYSFSQTVDFSETMGFSQAMDCSETMMGFSQSMDCEENRIHSDSLHFSQNAGNSEVMECGPPVMCKSESEKSGLFSQSVSLLGAMNNNQISGNSQFMNNRTINNSQFTNNNIPIMNNNQGMRLSADSNPTGMDQLNSNRSSREQSQGALTDLAPSDYWSQSDSQVSSFNSILKS